MSDKPLFQNQDEQEKVYAPDQLPEGTRGEQAAELEGDKRDDGTMVNPGLVPGVAAIGGAVGGTGPSTGGGTLSGVAPVAGGAALENNLDRDETEAERDRERNG